MAFDNTKPADNRTWDLAAGDIRANNDALETLLGVDLDTTGKTWTVADLITKGPWLDIRAFGAVGDAVLSGTWSGTDDTAAIQAAIDAQTVTGVGEGTVFIPEGNFMFSNLTIPPRTRIIGANRWTSNLIRIVGSVGNALEDTGSAAKIQLENFTVNGNGTTGIGIDLGNNTTQFGTDAYIDKVIVRDITNGFDINGNVGYIGTVLCQNNTSGTAFRLRGVANVVDVLAMVSVDGAITKGFYNTAEGTRVYALHTEGNYTNPVYIDNTDTNIENWYLSVAASTTITDALHLTSNAIHTTIGNFIGNTTKASAVITNFVNDQYTGETQVYQDNVGEYTQGVWNYRTAVITATKTIANVSSFDTVIARGLSADINVKLPQMSKALNQQITFVNDDPTWELEVRKFVSDGAGVTIAGKASPIFLKPGESITLKADLTVWNYVAGTFQPLIVIPALADDATPTIRGAKKWLTGGTTTITDFDDGYEGKEIIIFAEHSVTITDGTNIFLSGSVNFVMTSTDTLSLTQKADGKWYETSRGDNGA